MDEALRVAGLIDADWRIPESSFDEMARRLPALDTRARRSPAERTNLVAAGIIRVQRVHLFLHRALVQRNQVEAD